MTEAVKSIEVTYETFEVASKGKQVHSSTSDSTIIEANQNIVNVWRQ